MKIAVLLSSYNGEKYLQKQLDSLFAQSYKNFDLFIRDDGSNDNTFNIINENKKRIKFFEKGKNIGVVKSFFRLLNIALHKNYDYFLFCDQDDIWFGYKIEKQLKYLSKENNSIPLLLHSDMKVIDEYDNIIANSFFRYSHLDYNKKSLNYLLMQNNITGNSIIINKKLAEMVVYDKNIIMHDWWMGLIASAFGKILFINEPLLSYRKHNKNVIGAQRLYSLDEIKKIFSYSIKNIILQAKSFKQIYYNSLKIEYQQLLNNFISLNNNLSKIEKVNIILRNKFYKQNFLKTLGVIWKI